jgi:hypothetical protein
MAHQQKQFVHLSPVLDMTSTVVGQRAVGLCLPVLTPVRPEGFVSSWSRGIFLRSDLQTYSIVHMSRE